jgi:hypothetical protein
MTETTGDEISGFPGDANPSCPSAAEGMTAAPAQKTIARGRTCGACTLCCKLLEVPALKKPQGVWCHHCTPGRGCMAYSTRPRECSDFVCGYLTNPDLGEEWKPSQSRIMLTFEPESNRIAAYVDPQRPDAWKREPYYSKLKQWARAAVPHRGQVAACAGRRTYIVFPDRDVDLGEVSHEELIVITERTTPLGVQLDAVKIRKDDPRARTLPRVGGRAP